jgi:hypothetical protein
MDEYSLHQFIIRKGKALENTPEFVSYRRTHRGNWGAIERIIRCVPRSPSLRWLSCAVSPCAHVCVTLCALMPLSSLRADARSVVARVVVAGWDVRRVTLCLPTPRAGCWSA